MYNTDYTTKSAKSQAENILKKAQIKKQYNKKIVEWLHDIGENDRAEKIRECATMIGFTFIDDMPHITRANFCRERICSVCAWRRQSKFIAQMLPTLSFLSEKGYEFIFATATIKNVKYEDLSKTVDNMLIAYDKLLKRRKIKNAWVGKVRSLELSYNSDTKTFHPHIHILIAVNENYFSGSDYISLEEFSAIWKDVLSLDYTPICDIRKVTDEERGAVETIKYALKPTLDKEPLRAFLHILKGRRLISFSGIFAEVRKKLKFSSFEDILIDEIETQNNREYSCFLYRFDCTGGVYKYYDKILYKGEGMRWKKEN